MNTIKYLYLFCARANKNNVTKISTQIVTIVSFLFKTDALMINLKSVLFYQKYLNLILIIRRNIVEQYKSTHL